MLKRCIVLLLAAASVAQKPAPAPTHTLTLQVEGVNQEGGNIGVLVFNSPRGWPEDRSAALKDVWSRRIPAQW